MTRDQFESALARFRTVQGGRVSQHDFFPTGRDHRAPYRLAELRVPCTVDTIGDLACNLAQLAVEVRGYMTVHTSDVAYLSIQIHVSRGLEEAELEDAPPATRAVT